jgi:hypothetical protein
MEYTFTCLTTGNRDGSPAVERHQQLNQIAKRANSMGGIYATDIEDIQQRQNEIWGQQREILRKLDKVLDAMK